jgi:hypothetical protein
VPILSNKASNLVTSISNKAASVVITSPGFDGEATVTVSYPKQDLTEIVYALNAIAGVNMLMGQPLHQAADGKLYLAENTTNTNVVGLATADMAAGGNAEYGALGSMEVADWTILTGGEGSTLQVGTKYFLQADGTYKTAIPTSGWLIHIGTGGTPTSLNIELGSTPIKL